jgi:hypothetical protein
MSSAMRTAYSILIECTPEHLWPFIEEPDLQMLWMKGLLANELTSEPPAREGSTFRLKIREGGQVQRYEGRITALERPWHLGIQFWGGSLRPGMVMRVDYGLQTVNTHTRLDYVAVLESGKLDWSQKLFLPLLRLSSHMQLRGFLKKLKALAESPV